MSNRIYTHDAKLQSQLDGWLEYHIPDPNQQMESYGVSEYMRLYAEQLVCDADVVLELYKQCPNPEKFRLEITIVDRENSSLEFTVDEPGATYDNALATFKDAVDHLDGLGWIGIEPTFKWVPVEEDDDTSCANGKDVIEELFPVIAGWETENPSKGRMLPSRVVFTRECFEELTKEIQSAEYTLGVQHEQEVEQPLRDAIKFLEERNLELRKELENQSTRHEQELESIQCYHEVERAMLRESFSYLLDIASDPHNPTDTEEQVAMSLARNAAHGEKLDFENLENLARQNGLDLCTLIVEGIKRG